MAAFNHNPVGGERPTAGEILPKGKYVAIITDSDVRNGKKPGAQFIWLERTIQEPAAYKNRKVFQKLNVRNPSKQAEEIAQKELNQLLDAIGMGQTVMNDTAQLHSKPHIIRVDIEEDETGSYEPQNIVRGAYPMSAGGVGVKAGAAPAPAPAHVPFHQRPGAANQAPAGNAGAAAQPAAAPAPSATGEAGTPATQEAAPPAQPASGGSLPPWMRKAG